MGAVRKVLLGLIAVILLGTAALWALFSWGVAAGGDGGWGYKGPDCPGEYANCSDVATPNHSVVLAARGGEVLTGGGEGQPFLEIGCVQGAPVVVFVVETDFFSGGSAEVLLVSGEHAAGPHVMAAATPWSVPLWEGLAQEALMVFDQAEGDGDGVLTAHLEGEGGWAEYRYPLEGFARNFGRLPCAADSASESG